MKKALIFMLSFQILFSNDESISHLKNELLNLKRQKILKDMDIEENSWISPATISASFEKNKDSTDALSENQRISASWSQDIFRSGGIQALIDKAKASGKADLIGIDMERSQYLKDIFTYLSKMKRDELVVEQNKLTLQNSEIDLIIIKKQYEVGNKDITDLNRAILDKDNARTTLIISQNTLQSYITELKKLIGENDIANIQIPAIPLITKNEYLVRNMELEQYSALVQRDIAAQQVTKSSYLPKLTLNGSVGYNKYEGNNIGYDGDSYSYGVTLSMPIDYNAENSIESSQLQLLQTKTSLMDRKAEIEEEYDNSIVNIKTYKQKINVAKEMKEIYKSLYKTTKAQSATGFKTNYDAEYIKNSLTIQDLEIKIQEYNILIEKIALYFNLTH
ncbi:TolC family protein [Sulfurovum mangrovi]|uniref:TolC family protein n=1 Tax=Sulfurovum mangrovi TaxID=2893889 RepID=UPI001E63E143|nr:TolC family protein [Sulfurovum mangrovi]UFH60206.1 TolC family protein [Sulfurovum mangrovi]